MIPVNVDKYQIKHLLTCLISGVVGGGSELNVAVNNVSVVLCMTTLLYYHGVSGVLGVYISSVLH